MKESKLSKILNHTVLGVLSFICVSPLVLVLINSFKTHKDIVRNPLAISFSAGFTNYIKAWNEANFSRSLINSVIYSGSTIIVVLICASLAAYVLSGKKVRGGGVFMMYFMVAMTVPVQLFLVPLYSFYAKLNLLGNHVAVSLILAACNLPLAISLLRAFFLGIPSELEEAARIDGANTKNVITRIILPIISPGLVTVAIIVGLNSWNEFLVSSTFLLGEKNFTAMLSLMALNGVNSANHGTNMAATVTLVAPVIVFFVLMQKKFIDGIVSGSVKG